MASSCRSEAVFKLRQKQGDAFVSALSEWLAATPDSACPTAPRLCARQPRTLKERPECNSYSETACSMPDRRELTRGSEAVAVGPRFSSAGLSVAEPRARCPQG